MPTVRIDDLTFNIDIHGAGPPLVLLHGFTGSARSWQPLAAPLSRTFRVAVIDLIGHGQSEAPTEIEHYRFNRSLDDLAEIASQLDLHTASWLGYSMGGRLALGLALRHPSLVSSLILESASPGLADPDERLARERSDAAMASRIARDGVDAFVGAWERLPLWISQANLLPEVLANQRQIRLQNRAAGLAGSLRGMGTGAQPSYWDHLGALRCRVLLVAGTLDTKFAAIAARMAAAIPNADLALIPDAGHAVHLERPDHFLSCVCQFLARDHAAQPPVRKESPRGK